MPLGETGHQLPRTVVHQWCTTVRGSWEKSLWFIWFEFDRSGMLHRVGGMAQRMWKSARGGVLVVVSQRRLQASFGGGKIKGTKKS